MKSTRLIFAILLLFAVKNINAQDNIRNVDAATFKQIALKERYMIIDLRTDDEIARKGKIPGAIQIDYLSAEPEKKLSLLDKSKTYMIYCEGGGRSSECAALMHNLGFKEIINLEKGFDEWRRKGFEIEKK
jgi:phage shock protein E